MTPIQALGPSGVNSKSVDQELRPRRVDGFENAEEGKDSFKISNGARSGQNGTPCLSETSNAPGLDIGQEDTQAADPSASSSQPSGLKGMVAASANLAAVRRRGNRRNMPAMVDGGKHKHGDVLPASAFRVVFQPGGPLDGKNGLGLDEDPFGAVVDPAQARDGSQSLTVSDSQISKMDHLQEDPAMKDDEGLAIRAPIFLWRL